MTQPADQNPFHGVTWHKRDRHWRAMLFFRGRNINLGSYDDPEVAARVWDWAALFLKKKKAKVRMNFDGKLPPEIPEYEVKIHLMNGGVPKERLFSKEVLEAVES